MFYPTFIFNYLNTVYIPNALIFCFPTTTLWANWGKENDWSEVTRSVLIPKKGLTVLWFLAQHFSQYTKLGVGINPFFRQRLVRTEKLITSRFC